MDLSPGASPPSLFSEEAARAGDPGPGERNYLDQLERRALELDALAAGPRSADGAVEEHAKRRVLLASLEASGLLSDERWQSKRSWLERWELPTLMAYLDAAASLIAYLESSERRARVAEARPQPVRGAPVSLDWFRLGSVPQEGLSSFEWLAWCEYVLVRQDLPTASDGEFSIRAGGPWYRFLWRRDDGVTPALVSVSPT